MEILAVVQERPFAILGVNEREKNVQWTSTWEGSAILKVSPFWIWLGEVGHGIWCNVVHGGIPEHVWWNNIKTCFNKAENILLSTHLCLWVEVDELIVVEQSSKSPRSKRVRRVHWLSRQNLWMNFS